MSEKSEGWVVVRTATWSSDDGFTYNKCPHRDRGACLRCRVGWLCHLWRIGNRVWYLP